MSQNISLHSQEYNNLQDGDDKSRGNESQKCKFMVRPICTTPRRTIKKFMIKKLRPSKIVILGGHSVDDLAKQQKSETTPKKEVPA